MICVPKLFPKSDNCEKSKCWKSLIGVELLVVKNKVCQKSNCITK